MDDQDNDQPANENLTPKEIQAFRSESNESANEPANQNLSSKEIQAFRNPSNEPAPIDDNNNVEAPTTPNPEVAPIAPAPQPLPNPGQAIDALTNPSPEERDQHALAWANDLANRHIQPKTYSDLFANKDTMSQLGLAFSVLLGGIGSGLTHTQNAALGMMDKIIDRDFEAQKQSKENANNYLRTEYEHQMQLAQQKLLAAQAGQIPLTNEQIKANTNNINSNVLLNTQAASKNNMEIASMQHYMNLAGIMPPSQQPQAQAIIDNVIKPHIIQNVQNRNAQANAQINAQSQLRNPQQPDSEQQFSSTQDLLRFMGKGDLASANEAKHVPGLGNASLPITPNDKERINSGINFQNELQGFINWSRAHSGSLNPSERNEGQAMAAQLQAAYRNATNGGVYKEGEQNFISKIITDNPTAFFNEVRKIPQLEAVQRESKAQLNQELKSKGIKEQPQIKPTWEQKQQEMPSKSGAQASSQAPVIVGPNGQRMTVKNGQWVPVQ